MVQHDASLAAIEQQMALYEVEKTVLLASYFPQKGTGISNFRIFSWIQKKPHFCMFGSLDFEHYFYQGLNELAELADAISGIKIYTGYQRIASSQLEKILALANEKKIPVMFHMGYCYTPAAEYTNERGPSPSVLIGHIAKFPDVNFIISHLAKPHLNELITLVVKHNNVYADMSGLIHSKFRRHLISKRVEDVKRFVSACGPHKLLFGTDFPVQTYQDSVYFVEQGLKHFSEEEKAMVYYGNAQRLLG